MKLIKLLLKIIGLLVLVFTILLVGFTAYFVMSIKLDENNMNEEIVKKNISLDDALAHQITTALENTSSTGIVDIKLDDYDMNEILYAVTKEIDIPFVKMLGAYVELNDEVYTLCVPFEVFGTPSIAKGEISMNADDKEFNISVNKLSVGKMSISSGVVSKVIDFVGAEKYIQKSLTKFGIDFTMTDNSLAVKLSRESLGNTLDKALEDSDERTLVNSLYSVFFLETEAVKINISNPLDMNVQIDFSTFNGSTDLSLDSASTKVTNLIKDKKISISDASLFFNYYISGYEYLTDEQKEEINPKLDKLSLSEKTMTGLIDRNEVNLTEVLLSQFLASESHGLVITDTTLNKMFSTMKFIGTTFGFASYRTNDSSYITIQSLVTNISDDYLDISLAVDLNGYVVIISVGLSSEPSNTVKLTATLDKLAIGSYTLNDNEEKEFFIFLSKVLNEDWISADQDSQTITFNFEKALGDNPVLKLAMTTANTTTTSLKKDSNPLAGGYIVIKMTMK